MTQRAQELTYRFQTEALFGARLDKDKFGVLVLVETCKISYEKTFSSLIKLMQKIYKRQWAIIELYLYFRKYR